jgi:hypothetical protein
MRKLEIGGDGDGGANGGSSRRTTPGTNGEAASASSGKWLYIGTAMTAASFFIHLLILFLVEPLKVLALPKAAAYAYSGIPLLFGIAFLLFTVVSFTRVKPRSEMHVAILIGAIVFGTLNIQGAAGIVRFFAKGPLGQALLGN